MFHLAKVKGVIAFSQYMRDLLEKVNLTKYQCQRNLLRIYSIFCYSCYMPAHSGAKT